MKRLLAFLLTMTMVIGLTACGSSASGEAEPAGGGEEGGEEKTYTIAFFDDSSINDGGWGTAIYNDMVAAAEANGWNYEVTDSISQDEYYDTIVSYCQLGVDLIYAPGNQYTDAVIQAAEEYPDQKFVQLNGIESTCEGAVNDNIVCLLPNARQIGHLVGALAGLMTKTGKLGFIGGMELDTTLEKYEGMKEAAAYVAEKEGRTVETLDAVYAGSFDASDKGIEFAKALIEQGADVFYGDASAVDTGARQAIDEYNEAQGEIKVYDIAQPADILGQNECIICSACTDNSMMLNVAMQMVMNDDFHAQMVYGDMANGALSAGKMSDLIPEDIQAKYQEYLTQIEDGTFMQD